MSTIIFYWSMQVRLGHTPILCHCFRVISFFCPLHGRKECSVGIAVGVLLVPFSLSSGLALISSHRKALISSPTFGEPFLILDKLIRILQLFIKICLRFQRTPHNDLAKRSYVSSNKISLTID